MPREELESLGEETLREFLGAAGLSVSGGKAALVGRLWGWVQPLPFLGDDIFVLIAAELDTRMLGRLACVAPRFWRPSVPDPTHKGSAPPELWSVAEEGARRRLVALWQGERRAAGGGSWLRALADAERLAEAETQPLCFASRSAGVDCVVFTTTRNPRLVASEAPTGMVKMATCTLDGVPGHAMATGVMRTGVHRADFKVIKKERGNSHMSVGVVADSTNVADPVLYGALGWGWGSSGCLWHNAFLSGKEFGGDSAWDGQEGWGKDDVLGLEVDFSAGTLTAFKNGNRLGELATGLSGELRWAVSLERQGECVSVTRV